ncbi:MAG: galactan export ABC transporter permease subunit Wzm/RfbD [Pseudonocardia sp.]
MPPTSPTTGATTGVTAAAAAPSRSWQRAFADLADGWRQRPLWGYLGWQDIKQRYRRSVLGPLWISISMAVIAVALGVLYGALFQQPIEEFLPYLATGLLIWNFISGCILDGSEVFIDNEGLIKHLAAPLSVHIYRLIWRQAIFFAHNFVIWVILFLIFRWQLDWTFLLVIPAILLLVINGTWLALVVGIVSTRFRDIPPVIAALTQLLFFVTPIVWNYDIFAANPDVAERARLAELNPVMHFVEIVRRPLLGDPEVLRHWIVAIAITLVGWGVALLFMRNYRARVAYWV